MIAARTVRKGEVASSTTDCVCSAVVRRCNDCCARRGFEHPSEVAFGRDWKVGVNDCPAHAEIGSVSDGRGCGSVEAAAEVGIFAKNPDALRFSPCRYPLVCRDHNHLGSRRGRDSGSAGRNRSSESRSFRLTEYGCEAGLGNAERLDGNGCKDHEPDSGRWVPTPARGLSMAGEPTEMFRARSVPLVAGNLDSLLVPPQDKAEAERHDDVDNHEDEVPLSEPKRCTGVQAHHLRQLPHGENRQKGRVLH